MEQRGRCVHPDDDQQRVGNERVELMRHAAERPVRRDYRGQRGEEEQFNLLAARVGVRRPSSGWAISNA
jgi:hypothetical protein